MEPPSAKLFDSSSKSEDTNPPDYQEAQETQEVQAKAEATQEAAAPPVLVPDKRLDFIAKHDSCFARPTVIGLGAWNQYQIRTYIKYTVAKVLSLELPEAEKFANEWVGPGICLKAAGVEHLVVMFRTGVDDALYRKYAVILHIAKSETKGATSPKY